MRGMRQKEPLEETAELGTVTLGGDPAGVSLGAPSRGEQGLVIKGGPGGEEQCVAGRVQDGSGLWPGEILLYCGKASIKLDREGQISLNGKLFINGKPYVAPLAV